VENACRFVYTAALTGETVNASKIVAGKIWRKKDHTLRDEAIINMDHTDIRYDVSWILMVRDFHVGETFDSCGRRVVTCILVISLVLIALLLEIYRHCQVLNNRSFGDWIWQLGIGNHAVVTASLFTFHRLVAPYPLPSNWMRAAVIQTPDTIETDHN